MDDATLEDKIRTFMAFKDSPYANERESSMRMARLLVPDLVAEITALRKQRDEAREALAPFAKLAKAALENELPAKVLECSETPVFSVGLAYADEWAADVSVGDLRAAAKWKEG
jgi:hypothetical protein